MIQFFADACDDQLWMWTKKQAPRRRCTDGKTPTLAQNKMTRLEIKLSTVLGNVGSSRHLGVLIREKRGD